MVAVGLGRPEAGRVVEGRLVGLGGAVRRQRGLGLEGLRQRRAVVLEGLRGFRRFVSLQRRVDGVISNARRHRDGLRRGRRTAAGR